MQQKQLTVLFDYDFFFPPNWVKHKLLEPFYCLELLLQL